MTIHRKLFRIRRKSDQFFNKPYHNTYEVLSESMENPLGIQRKSYQNPIGITTNSYQNILEILSEYLGGCCNRITRTSYQNPWESYQNLLEILSESQGSRIRIHGTSFQNPEEILSEYAGNPYQNPQDIPSKFTRSSHNP